MKWTLALLATGCSLLLANANGARADGGTVRATETHDGLTITVMTDPTPPRAGAEIDTSILVQNAETKAPVDIEKAFVVLESPDPQANANVRITAPARKENATNKLYLSAKFRVKWPGPWEGKAEVTQGEKTISVPFKLMVETASPPAADYSPWLVLPMVVIAIFLTRLVRRRVQQRRFEIPPPKRK